MFVAWIIDTQLIREAQISNFEDLVMNENIDWS